MPGQQEAGREPGGEAPVKPVTPRLTQEPPRAKQDNQPMDGEEATHLPEETELIQKPRVQG